MTELNSSQLKKTRVIIDKLAPDSYSSTARRSRRRSHSRHHHKSHQSRKRNSEKRRRCSSSREKGRVPSDEDVDHARGPLNTGQLALRCEDCVVKRAKHSMEDMEKKFIHLFGSKSPPPPLDSIRDITGRDTYNNKQKRTLRSRIQFTESSDDEDDDVQFIETIDTTNSNETEAKPLDNEQKPCQYAYEKPCPKSKKKNVIIIGNKKKIEKNIHEENTAESPPICNVKNAVQSKITLEFKSTNDIKSDTDETRSAIIQISSKEECQSRAIDEQATNIHKTPIVIKSNIKSEIIDIEEEEATLEDFIQKIGNQLCDQAASVKSENKDIPKLTLKPIESLLTQNSIENENPKTCEQQVLNTPDVETSVLLQALKESTNEKDKEQPTTETHATHSNENAVVLCDPVRSLAEYILFLMREREKYAKSIEEIEKCTNKDMILQMKTNAQSQLVQNESLIYQQTVRYFQQIQMKSLNNTIFMEHVRKATIELAGKTRIIESFNEIMYSEVLMQMIIKAQEYFIKLAMPNVTHGQNSVLCEPFTPYGESIKEPYNKNDVTSFQQVYVDNLGSYKEQLGGKTLASTNSSSFLNSSVPIPQYSTSSSTIDQLCSYVNTHKTQKRHQSHHSEIRNTSSNGTPSYSTSTALNLPDNTYMFPKRAMISETRNPPPYEHPGPSHISGSNESVYANHPQSRVPIGNIQHFQKNSPLNYMCRDSVQQQYQSQNNMIFNQLRTPNPPANQSYQSNSSYQVGAGNQYVNNLLFRTPPVQTSQPSPSYQVTNRNYYAYPPPNPYMNESRSKYVNNAHTINNNLTNATPSPTLLNLIPQRSTNNAYQSPTTLGAIKTNPTATIQQCQMPNGSNAIQWGNDALSTWNNSLANNRYENQRVVNNEEYYKGSVGVHQSAHDVPLPPARVAVPRTWNDRSQSRPPSAPVLPEQVRSISRDSGFMSPTAAGMVITPPIDSTRLVPITIFCKCVKRSCISCKCAKAQVGCTALCKCGGHPNRRTKTTKQKESCSRATDDQMQNV